MHLPQDIVSKFQDIYSQAEAQCAFDHTAVSLATADASGKPRVRTILLKKFDSSGFMFVTNHDSIKGGQMKQNPAVSLCFYWPEINQQVVVEGVVELGTVDESDKYWESRPRDRQIGGVASNQSAEVASKDEMQASFARVTRQYEGQSIPRPPQWGAFWVRPKLIEFWVSQAGRLHDREQYSFERGQWLRKILQP